MLNLRTENIEDNEKQKKGVMKVVRKVGVIASTALLILSVLAFGVVMWRRVSGGVPKLFDISFHFVVTKSMQPDINVGDIVFAHSVGDFSELVVGSSDVIYYNSKEDKIIVHRLHDIDLEKRILRTYGINNGGIIDAPTSFDSVIGVRIGKSVILGQVFSFLINNRTIIFVVMLLCILVISASEIIKIFKISFDKSNEAMRNAEIELIKEQLRAEMNSENNCGVYSTESPQKEEETHLESTTEKGVSDK